MNGRNELSGDTVFKEIISLPLSLLQRKQKSSFHTHNASVDTEAPEVFKPCIQLSEGNAIDRKLAAHTSEAPCSNPITHKNEEL